jgi:HEAT repeat protein
MLAALLAALIALPLTGCSKGREARIEEVLRRSRAEPDRIVELQSAFLKDDDSDVRALAVWAIGDAGAKDGAAAIAPLASDPSGPVRLAVAKSLCRLGGEETIAPLTTLVSDTDDEARRAAVRCLAALQPPPAGLLARALGDSDDEIRKLALAALGAHPDPAALQPLIGVLQRRAPDEQLAAVTAIRSLEDPQALPALEAEAAERLSPAVRDAVESAILALRASAAKQAKEKDAAQAKEKEAAPTRESGGDAGSDKN